MAYEVKKNGVSVEWTKKYSEAETAFKDSGPGECYLYRITPMGKQLLKAK